ncbi:MAG: PH domain-containing protein [Microthrixaceae bacterium]
MLDRKLNRLTPWARATSISPGVIIVVLFFGAGSGWARVAAAAATLLVLFTFGVGIMYLEWKRYSFGFDDTGDFRVEKGVIQHSHQKVQLSRLQSVEVAQPLIPRLFGLAEVVVEVAGAGDSRVKVSYLDNAGAQALRNEIVARAAGVDATAPSAPEAVLTAVDNNQLLLSLLLRFSTLGLFVLTGLLLVTAFLTGGWGALGIALVTGGVPAFGVVNEFLQKYGFTVAESPDGLRVRHGLTSTIASTVPPGRVHAVGFRSGPIWRMFGWVKVVVDLGGNPGSGDNNRDSTTLIPVTDWDTALMVVGKILPGVDLSDIDFAPAPERARWRAPIQRRRIGYAVHDEVFIARRGRIEQWLAVVPHGRVQSVRITQGPYERSLRLGSLHLDTVPGPVHVTVPHMDIAGIRSLAEQEQDRARAARIGAGPDRWMRT